MVPKSSRKIQTILEKARRFQVGIDVLQYDKMLNDKEYRKRVRTAISHCCLGKALSFEDEFELIQRQLRKFDELSEDEKRQKAESRSPSSEGLRAVVELRMRLEVARTSLCWSVGMSQKAFSEWYTKAKERRRKAINRRIQRNNEESPGTDPGMSSREFLSKRGLGDT